MSNDQNDDEPTWLSMKEAAEVTDVPERRIRFWKDHKKIRSRTFEDRSNAPIFVAVEDIETKMAERAEIDSEKPKETLPIPVKVFEEMQVLNRRLVEEAAARAKVETQLEFFKARLHDLEAERASAAVQQQPRHWWQKRQIIIQGDLVE